MLGEKSIAIIGTLDTKGNEIAYIKQKIEEQGFSAVVIDVGVLGEPLAKANYSRGEVSELGGKKLSDLIESARQGADRSDATVVMIRGAITIVKEFLARGLLHGIISLGGSTGTTIGISAMKALPIGIPKLMVCTNLTHSLQAGEKDVMVMQTPADIMGLNRIMRRALSQAANAMVGMVKTPSEPEIEGRPIIGITALGVTTPAVMHLMSFLERSGDEVIVFHNRTGVLEELLENGTVKGVIDLSLGELVWAYIADILPERKSRLDIVHTISIPMIITPGSLDMIIFSHRSVPRKYNNRLTSKHGPYVTLVKTSIEEIRKLGKIIASKANGAKGPTAIVIPLKGFSSMDKEGQLFYDPALVGAFVETVKSKTEKHVQVIEVESHINDYEFALKVRHVLDKMRGVRDDKKGSS